MSAPYARAPAAPRMDVVDAIEVAGTTDGCYDIRWTPDFTTRPVTVYAGVSPVAIDLDEPVAHAVVGAAHIDGLAALTRHYFLLQPGDGDCIVVAARGLPLQGGVNFRDIGGYATADGRRVRWGAVFRSGHMTKLTDADRAYLAPLNIMRVCDFRHAEECRQEPTRLPNDPVTEHLSIPAGIKGRYFLHRLLENTDDPHVVAEAMHEIVRALVMDSAPPYARLFEILLDAGDQTVLINCSAGKDRTGVAVAMLLAALGVPRQTVLHDFTLSARHFPADAEFERVRLKYGVSDGGAASRRLLDPLLVTRTSYLHSAFDLIDERYGTIDRFLRQRYGLGDRELARLRDRYTQ